MHKSSSGATTQCCCFKGSDLLLLWPVWESWAAASAVTSSHWMNPVPCQSVTWSWGPPPARPPCCQWHVPSLAPPGLGGAIPIQCKSMSWRCHTVIPSLGHKQRYHVAGRRKSPLHIFLRRTSIHDLVFLHFLYFSLFIVLVSVWHKG